MRYGIRKLLPVLLAGMLVFSACASYPEISEQQHDRVVNYASGILIRYMKDSPDKLTYLDTAYTPQYLIDAGTITPPVPQEGTADPQGQQTTVPENTPPAQENPPEDTQQGTQEAPADTPGEGESAGTLQEEQPAAQPGEEDTSGQPGGEAQPGTEPEQPGTEPEQPGTEPEQPVTEPEQTGTETGTGTETAAPVNVVPLESSMLQTVAGGLPVEYNGYSIRNAYPDTSAQGAVIAMPGDRLLTVDFRIRNNTEQNVTINTAHFGPQYKLVINGDVQGFTLVTMIENDLSSLYTTLAPGEAMNAVLLMELPEDLAKSVDRLALIIRVNGEDQTVELE
ncbi:MAG: hypothetical protein IJP92_05615 [Lachnospiraceae bacterium]|nr:hypothetical protein [Lachnospiraceae bacterium]